MHKYEIISRSYDKHWKFKPSDWYQVVDLIRQVIGNETYYSEVECFLKGKKATPEQLLEAALDEHDAYLEKKNQTHRKVWVGTGVTGFVKKPVWVRK